jgi:hypothetical protein
MTLATDLVDQLRVMCLSIPFNDKGHQAISEVIKVGEVEDAQPLPLQNTEPLLHLVHPRAVDRHEEKRKARVRLQPCLDLFAFMHAQVVKNQTNATDRDRNLLI